MKNEDRWVMVRDNATDEWKPRIFLRELDSRLPYRYLCLSQQERGADTWRQMRPAKAIELLPMLPGEWAKRAMLRAKECSLVTQAEESTLAEALYHAIRWDDTSEGHHVWHSLHDALRDGTEIPECPPLAGEPAPAPEPRTCGRVVRYEFFEEGK